MKTKIVLVGNGIINNALYHNAKFASNCFEMIIYSRNNNNNYSYVTDNIEIALKNAQIIISCVKDDDAAWSFWNNSIVKEYLENNKITCIEMSTLSYDFMMCLHNHFFIYANVTFIECTFTGSEKGARNGELSLFIYCDENVSETVKMFFSIISKQIYEFNNKSEPTKFKLLYNLWNLSELYMFSEILPIIKAEFNDDQVAKTALKSEGWMANLMNDKLDICLNNNFDNLSFKYDYVIKDYKYALSLFSPSHMPIVKQIKKIYENNNINGWNNKDFTIISSIYDDNVYKTASKVREKIKEKCKSLNLLIDVFMTGSYTRGDFRNCANRNYASDIDFIISIDENQLVKTKNALKSIDFIDLDKYELTILICNYKILKNNNMTSLAQNIDFEYPLIKLSNRLYDFNYKKEMIQTCQMQPILYYFSKYLLTNDPINILKSSISIIKYDISKTLSFKKSILSNLDIDDNINLSSYSHIYYEIKDGLLGNHNKLFVPEQYKFCMEYIEKLKIDKINFPLESIQYFNNNINSILNKNINYCQKHIDLVIYENLGFDKEDAIFRIV